jgi:hypothetical protein
MAENLILSTTVDNPNSLELVLNGETIILSLESDVDFTDFVKKLSTLIPAEKQISFEQPNSDDPKTSLVLKTIADIINCFNTSLASTTIEEVTT